MMSERPETQGFQKPLDDGKRTEVRMAVVRYGEGYAACSCGAPFVHHRKKVIEDMIDKHLAKKHGGRGIRL